MSKLNYLPDAAPPRWHAAALLHYVNHNAHRAAAPQLRHQKGVVDIGGAERGAIGHRYRVDVATLAILRHGLRAQASAPTAQHAASQHGIGCQIDGRDGTRAAALDGGAQLGD